MRRLQGISRLLAGEAILVSSVYAENLLEDFFIAAVASVLAIRLYLRVTGYPRIEVGGYHISHVLFGGALMLLAIVILLAFLNRSSKEIAAVAGGAGFGAFIDELGKFITSDNDYFFQPAASLIYITFVLLFFLIRFFTRRRSLTSQECLVNALEIAEQGSISGIDPEEIQTAFRLLGQCQKSSTVVSLETILQQMTALSFTRASFSSRLKKAVHRFYEYLAGTWWFGTAIIGIFALISITPLYALVAAVNWSWGLGLWVGGSTLILIALFRSRRTRFNNLVVPVTAAIIVVSILMTWAILGSLKQKPLPFIDWAQLLSPSVSGIIVVTGLLLIPASRLRAYRMFRSAIMVSIFFTQVLSFYQHQFLALGGLLVNIAILLALRYIIIEEEARQGEGR